MVQEVMGDDLVADSSSEEHIVGEEPRALPPKPVKPAKAQVTSTKTLLLWRGAVSAQRPERLRALQAGGGFVTSFLRSGGRVV